MPRFSAAMEGWRIQVCNRSTDSWCRFSISFLIASISLLGNAPVHFGSASVAALAATPCKNVRRSTPPSLSAPLGLGHSLIVHLRSSVLTAQQRESLYLPAAGGKRHA